MRQEIICRFENETDFKNFCIKNNLPCDKNIVKYNIKTREIKLKKISKSKNKKEDYSNKYWIGMPEYISVKQEPYAKIEINFEQDIELAKSVLEQNITEKTTSVWYPKLITGKHSKWRVIGGNLKPKYPIYIVSKNRADKCYTSRFLSNMLQEHYIVVEPEEYDKYVSENKNEYCTILSLDMKYKDNYDTFDKDKENKNTGPGPARNFCWEHSIKNGYRYHWVMDDNANEGFFYMWRNKKIKCRTSTIFRCCEDFMERYDNLAITGLNYAKFCKESDKTPPFVLNTRIYSFLLIKNDIPFRWRGRYNEDTDLSLRVLKSGLCTLQFNAFLAGKATTQKIQGGNTEEFYNKEGTLPKSQMLEQMHPDIAKVVWKFNRWHHQVDYSKFKQNLICNVNFDKYKNIDYYGIKIIATEENTSNDTKSYLQDKYKKSEVLNNV